jgi:hypothetical protein
MVETLDTEVLLNQLGPLVQSVVGDVAGFMIVIYNIPEKPNCTYNRETSEAIEMLEHLIESMKKRKLQ